MAIYFSICAPFETLKQLDLQCKCYFKFVISMVMSTLYRFYQLGRNVVNSLATTINNANTKYMHIKNLPGVFL